MAVRVRPSALVLLLALAGPLAADDHTTRTTRTVTDRQIIDTLRDIHNLGADLFNRGDPSGCYHLFQGSLVTVKPLLPDELKQAVDEALTAAARQADLNRRAFVLHEAIESVRVRLHATLPLPRKVPEGTQAGTNPARPVGPPNLEDPPKPADPPRVVKPDPPKVPVIPTEPGPMPDIPVVAPPTAPATPPTVPPSIPLSPPTAAPPSSPEPPLAPVKPDPPVVADSNKPQVEVLTVPPRPELPPVPAVPAGRDKDAGPPLFPPKP